MMYKPIEKDFKLNFIYDLERKISKENYAGFDPYDGLNSYLGVFKERTTEIIITQFFRRFPLNLRPILGVTKGVNPKGLGLMLSVYAELYNLNQDVIWLGKIDNILQMLNECKWVGDDYVGWGYNFDWRNRNFKLPRYSPTSVNTSFILHGLLDVKELPLKNSVLRNKLIELSTVCLVRHFNFSQFDSGTCISYSRYDHSCVHNANLLAAASIHRSTQGGNKLYTDLIHSMVSFSVRSISDTGRIPYGFSSKQNWADSFHTGFVLEQVRYLQDYLSEQEKNLIFLAENYYKQNYFGISGEPYYYEKSGVFDIHSPAQAIRYFQLTGDFAMESKVRKWTFQNLLGPNGWFYFRKNRYFTNKINYMRWSQIWMLYGLSTNVRLRQWT